MLPTVKPLILVLSLAYAAGAPGLDGLRPKAVDQSLRLFHAEVTLLAGEGLRAATGARHDTLLAHRLLNDVTRALDRVL